MAQRRPHPGGRRLQRGDPRVDAQINLGPFRLGLAIQHLADRRGHREHPGITAGDHRHMAPLSRQVQGLGRTRQFLPVVRGMAAVLFRGQAVQVGLIPHQIRGHADDRPGLRRHPARPRRPHADHVQALHTRTPGPGIKTMEK